MIPGVYFLCCHPFFTDLDFFLFCNYVLVLTTKFTAISEIKCGKTDLYLKARVIHLWSVPDKLNPAEDGSLQMVLLDEKVCIYSIN